MRQHCTLDDGWAVINGIVYNMTPYVRFHPGGPDILKAAMGKDATSLFYQYHSWVNVQALMNRCVVGLLAPPKMPAAPEQPTNGIKIGACCDASDGNLT